jgi:hypothetical protein
MYPPVAMQSLCQKPAIFTESGKSGNTYLSINIVLTMRYIAFEMWGNTDIGGP